MLLAGDNHSSDCRIAELGLSGHPVTPGASGSVANRVDRRGGAVVSYEGRLVVTRTTSHVRQPTSPTPVIGMPTERAR